MQIKILKWIEAIEGIKNKWSLFSYSYFLCAAMWNEFMYLVAIVEIGSTLENCRYRLRKYIYGKLKNLFKNKKMRWNNKFEYFSENNFFLHMKNYLKCLVGNHFNNSKKIRRRDHNKGL